MTIPTAALLGLGGGGGGTGTVDSVTGTPPITVDNADPANPIVGISAGVGTLKVRLAASTNTGRTGLAAIDGVVPVAGDRILCLAETAPANNGIYAAAAGAWTRSTDFDAAGEMIPGVLVSVTEGTIYADSLWMFATTGVIVVGTTALAFALVGPTFGADTRVNLPNSALTEVEALKLLAVLSDNTPGSERSEWQIRTLFGGVQALALRIDQDVLYGPRIYFFQNDQNTGFANPGADNITYIVGGVNIFALIPSGIVLNATSQINWGAGFASIARDGVDGSLMLSPDAAQGNTEVGLAGGLATNATHGFGCIPTCAGTPTGTPAGQSAGMVPMVVDSTNNKLYGYYGGAWHDLTGA